VINDVIVLLVGEIIAFTTTFANKRRRRVSVFGEETKQTAGFRSIVYSLSTF